MKGEKLIIIEDDESLSATLMAAFGRRGYACRWAPSCEDLPDLVKDWQPQFAIVDLKLQKGTGLECVKCFSALEPRPRIVVLTGYASIATAVEAIKLGACHYLAKPATASEIEAAFSRTEGDVSVSVTNRKASLRTLEWERIQETLKEADFNISEAARRLGMHRRTLARKLGKKQIN